MALGAEAGRVLRSVVFESLGVTSVGLVLGLAVALVLGRALEGQLFGVTSRDPLSILGVLPIVLQVALLAAIIPSIRASRIQPLVAMEGTE
jgi:ABC-type antimicrobial peptide transport system permease subunit